MSKPYENAENNHGAVESASVAVGEAASATAAVFAGDTVAVVTTERAFVSIIDVDD